MFLGADKTDVSEKIDSVLSFYFLVSGYIQYQVPVADYRLPPFFTTKVIIQTQWSEKIISYIIGTLINRKPRVVRWVADKSPITKKEY